MAKIQTKTKGWKFVGGFLCLDFANTVGGRLSSGAVLRDKLVEYSDLLEWAQRAGVVNRTEFRSLDRLAESHKKEAHDTFLRALILRETLYRTFKSEVDGRRPPRGALEVLSHEIRLARARERLVHASGTFNWTFQDSEAALDRVLWPVALSAAELLTSGDLSRLRQCDGERCGWLFLDTSRNRSRHWCDMKDCGNRAKVRRFRTRLQRSHRRIRSA